MLIVKLGGSVIQEDLTNVNPKVFTCVERLLHLHLPIVIVTGGGKICRLFQNALKENGCTNVDNLHWVGTRVVNLQSEFIKSIFPVENTFPFLIDSDEMLSSALNSLDKYMYFAAGGWNIGHSSDYDAAKMALFFKTTEVLRISDINYVYDGDPDKNPDAKKIERATWQEYLDIIGNPGEHVPGASYPVDPIAAQVAMENNLKFYFTSLDKFLEVETLDFSKFQGTVIG